MERKLRNTHSLGFSEVPDTFFLTRRCRTFLSLRASLSLGMAFLTYSTLFVLIVRSEANLGMFCESGPRPCGPPPCQA